METITIKNYPQVIGQIGLSRLNAAQKETHEFITELGGDAQDFYDQDEAIRATVDLYFSQLAKMKQARAEKRKVFQHKSRGKKPQAPPEEKKEARAEPKTRPPRSRKRSVAPKKAKSPKQRKRVAPKRAIKKVSTKPAPKPSIHVKRYSLELSLLRRYANMHGKKRSVAALKSLSTTIGKAQKEGRIAEYKTDLDSIAGRLSKAVSRMQKEKLAETVVEIHPDYVQKIKGLVKNARERIRVSFLAGTKYPKSSPEATILYHPSLGKLPDEFKLQEVVLRMKKSTSKRFSGEPVTSSTQALEVLRRIIGKDLELREVFVVLYMDRSNKLIGYQKHSIGGTFSTVIDAKLVFLPAVKLNASAIIVCHNHPSGNHKPSGADLEVTKKLGQVAKTHDVTLLDSVIVTKTGYYSFADSGVALSGLAGFGKKD